MSWRARKTELARASAACSIAWAQGRRFQRVYDAQVAQRSIIGFRTAQTAIAHRKNAFPHSRRRFEPYGRGSKSNVQRTLSVSSNCDCLWFAVGRPVENWDAHDFPRQSQGSRGRRSEIVCVPICSKLVVRPLCAQRPALALLLDPAVAFELEQMRVQRAARDLMQPR